MVGTSQRKHATSEPGWFHRAFAESHNKIGLSVFLLAAWIADADGHASHDELKCLADIGQANSLRVSPAEIVTLVRRRNVSELQLACEAVAQLRPDRARLLLQLLVGVALSDGRLVTAENHVLRLLADVLRLGESGLNSVFREITGSPIPTPTDVSDPDTWNSRPKNGGGNEGGNEKERERKASSHQVGSDLPRLRNLAILGLDERASPEQITEAYRRLAKVHHPDRFAVLGEEAVRQATETFQRIQAAYEQLSRS